jgi:hypothetical protein
VPGAHDAFVPTARDSVHVPGKCIDTLVNLAVLAETIKLWAHIMASTRVTDNRGLHSRTNRIETSGNRLWTVASDSNTADRILLLPHVPSCTVVQPRRRHRGFGENVVTKERTGTAMHDSR